MRSFPIKFYIAILIVAPITFQYSVEFARLTLADVSLVMALCLLFLSKNSKAIRLQFPMLILFVFVLLHTMIAGSTFVNDSADIFGTTFRYLLYIASAIFVINVQSEVYFAEKLYIYIAVVSACFLLFQICIYYFGAVYVPGTIPFLPLIDSSLYGYADVLNAAETKRFMAFFGEPSHFAIYVLGALSILLFSKNFFSKKRIVIAIYLTFSIVLSTSILGALISIVLWAIYFVKSITSRVDRLDARLILVVPLVLLLVFLVLGQTQAFSYISNVDIFERQADGRFSGYLYVYQYYVQNPELLIFGNGVNEWLSEEYLAGLPRILFYFGLLGCFIYAACFVFSCKRKDALSEAMLLLIILISTGSEFIFGILVLPYYIFLICGENTDDTNLGLETIAQRQY